MKSSIACLISPGGIHDKGSRACRRACPSGLSRRIGFLQKRLGVRLVPR